MTRDELRSKLQLLLRHAGSAGGHRIPYELPGASITALQSIYSPDFIWTGAPATLQLESVGLLRAMYAQTPPELRGDFISMLKERVSNETADVVGHSLIELGQIRALGEVTGNSDAIARLWRAVRLKVCVEPSRFTDDNLAALQLAALKQNSTWSRGLVEKPEVKVPPEITTAFDQLHRTIDRVRYFRFRNQLLESHQPQIDADAKVLASRMAALGFPSDLESAFEEVERQIRGAATPINFKTCMDLLRSVLDRFHHEAAGVVGKRLGRSVPGFGGPKAFNACNQFLVGESLLTETEGNVFQQLYNFLSQEGAHKLSSEPEQVRVARATIVEWTMMLAGRLQQWLQRVPQKSSSPGDPPETGPA